MANKYVIIGGVAAGASAATRLRRLDEKAEIIMFDKGLNVSFSNCSLPYRISETVDSDDKLVIMSPEKFAKQYNIDARTLSEVIEINESDKTVKVKNLQTAEIYTEEYDKLIVSPGAKAIIPSFVSNSKIPLFTLKTVSDTTKLMNFIYENDPSDVVIVGGGFIGVETAENLQKRGIKVTIVEASEQIISPFDFEISLHANEELEKNGVKVIVGDPVDRISGERVILNSGKELNTDAIILSIGVKPETGFLKGTSIELDNRGHIITNSNYQTANSDIYAAGDAIIVRNALSKQNIPLSLAGSANKQGRLIADHINGRTIINNGYIGSSIVKIFDLEFARTGLNEKEIKAMDKPYDYQITYAAPTNKVSLMPGVSPILMKIIFEKNSGLVLGAQFVSKSGADKRIDVVATAIKFKATVFDLADLELAYAPQFSTGKDPVNKIGYQASELVLGAFEKVNFTDVYDLVENRAQIIDIREANERNSGCYIKGSKNIPMSELRNRLGEIDKNKKVYVHCQSGQRSYNITKALGQLGYDVYNIAGSMIFLKSYEKQMKKLDKSRKEILK